MWGKLLTIQVITSECWGSERILCSWAGKFLWHFLCLKGLPPSSRYVEKSRYVWSTSFRVELLTLILFPTHVATRGDELLVSTGLEWFNSSEELMSLGLLRMIAISRMKSRTCVVVLCQMPMKQPEQHQAINQHRPVQRFALFYLASCFRRDI